MISLLSIPQVDGREDVIPKSALLPPFRARVPASAPARDRLAVIDVEFDAERSVRLKVIAAGPTMAR